MIKKYWKIISIALVLILLSLFILSSTNNVKKILGIQSVGVSN